jgi:hypothetical protein
MDWVKNNYEKFILALVSVLLLVFSAMLIMNARSFSNVFDGIRGQIVPNNKVPKVPTADLEQAHAYLEKPVSWGSHPGSLFVSERYIVRNGNLIRLDAGSTPIHPPIPNKWLLDNELDLLSATVLTDDPDGDGFTNLDEWQNVKGDGSDSTDPQSKESRPAYTTKLFLKQFIKQPFLLRFASYDGDPNQPDSLSFQINAITAGKPSQFLKMGDEIAGTKFKIVNFEPKKFVDANEIEQDVSELTVQHSDTGEKVLLILGKTVDSPDSYALFKFVFDGSEFRVKKDQQFGLKPQPDVLYKLIDIQETEALIENLKTAEKIKIPRLK